jgi:hypothetical protein
MATPSSSVLAVSRGTGVWQIGHTGACFEGDSERRNSLGSPDRGEFVTNFFLFVEIAESVYSITPKANYLTATSFPVVGVVVMQYDH